MKCFLLNTFLRFLLVKNVERITGNRSFNIMIAIINPPITIKGIPSGLIALTIKFAIRSLAQYANVNVEIMVSSKAIVTMYTFVLLGLNLFLIIGCPFLVSLYPKNSFIMM